MVWGGSAPGFCFPEGVFQPWNGRRDQRAGGLFGGFIAAVGKGLTKLWGPQHPLFSGGPVILVSVTA